MSDYFSVSVVIVTSVLDFFPVSVVIVTIVCFVHCSVTISTYRDEHENSMVTEEGVEEGHTPLPDQPKQHHEGGEHTSSTGSVSIADCCLNIVNTLWVIPSHNEHNVIYM